MSQPPQSATAAPKPLHHGKGIPRGLARTGPALFSYGFRPFFLGGAVWALLAMVLFLTGLSGAGFVPGGDYGLIAWHQHEMLFGFAPAVLAGFLMTAIPNWTGRMPLSGRPLMALAALWLAGRVLFALPSLAGMTATLLIEAAFLPVLAAVFLIELVAGKKWRDIKVVAIVGLLAVANVALHLAVLRGWGDASGAARLAVAGYVMLVVIIGGRITPSFTTNWLRKRGARRLPHAFGRFDAGAAITSGAALVAWVTAPEGRLTALICLAAGLVNLIRLARWRGWATWREPLVLMLHLSWLMLAAGFLAQAGAAQGWISMPAALHVFAIGVIGAEMMAVMARATRGHTARVLHASAVTCAAFAAIMAAAALRPLAELVGDYDAMIRWAGGLWIAGWLLFLVEYAPMLTRARQDGRAG